MRRRVGKAGTAAIAAMGITSTWVKQRHAGKKAQERASLKAGININQD